MEPIVLLAVVGVVGVLGLLAVGVARQRSQRQDDWLAPARLGPAWSPSGSEPGTAPDDPELRAARVEAVQARTGLDRATVETVLSAWDEYLAVIGLARLPAGHAYQVYDPYVPPVAERGPEGPVPDPTRVARDVEGRTSVSRTDAAVVLDALLEVAQGDDGAAGS